MSLVLNVYSVLRVCVPVSSFLTGNLQIHSGQQHYKAQLLQQIPTRPLPQDHRHWPLKTCFLQHLPVFFCSCFQADVSVWYISVTGCCYKTKVLYVSRYMFVCFCIHLLLYHHPDASGITLYPSFPSGINVQVTMRLDKEYTADLDDPSSAAFQDLQSRLDTVVSTISKARQFPSPAWNIVFYAVTCLSPQLWSQFSKIIGFQNVFVTGFRYIIRYIYIFSFPEKTSRKKCIFSRFPQWLTLLISFPDQAV